MKLNKYLTENTSKSTERELEKNYRVFLNTVKKIADREYKKTLVPFLKKRNWKFVSGMCTWWIGPETKGRQSYYVDDFPHDTEFQEIDELLNVEIPGANGTLGEFMPDYKG